MKTVQEICDLIEEDNYEEIKKLINNKLIDNDSINELVTNKKFINILKLGININDKLFKKIVFLSKNFKDSIKYIENIDRKIFFLNLNYVMNKLVYKEDYFIDAIINLIYLIELDYYINEDFLLDAIEKCELGEIFKELCPYLHILSNNKYTKVIDYIMNRLNLKSIIVRGDYLISLEKDISELENKCFNFITKLNFSKNDFDNYTDLTYSKISHKIYNNIKEIKEIIKLINNNATEMIKYLLENEKYYLCNEYINLSYKKNNTELINYFLSKGLKINRYCIYDHNIYEILKVLIKKNIKHSNSFNFNCESIELNNKNFWIWEKININLLYKKLYFNEKTGILCDFNEETLTYIFICLFSNDIFFLENNIDNKTKNWISSSGILFLEKNKFEEQLIKNYKIKNDENKLLKDNVEKIKQTFKYSKCYEAAEKGDLIELKRMYENGCDLNDYYTTAYAAENGHLDCLKYAHENGCEWNFNCTSYAAENRHLDCLKYAHENGCEIDSYTSRYMNSIDYINYLKYNYKK